MHLCWVAHQSQRWPVQILDGCNSEQWICVWCRHCGKLLLWSCRHSPLQSTPARGTGPLVLVVNRIVQSTHDKGTINVSHAVWADLTDFKKSNKLAVTTGFDSDWTSVINLTKLHGKNWLSTVEADENAALEDKLEDHQLHNDFSCEHHGYIYQISSQFIQKCQDI